jgi:hypothetical protein
MDVVNTISGNPYYDTAISDVQPTLNLDFVNAKTLDSRITFARATTATFYNANSSAVAEQNLFTASNNLAGYTTADATLSLNTSVAPDGTTTASTLTATASTAFHTIVLAAWTGTYTVSIFAKAGTNNFVQFSSDATNQIYANFNLSTGALGTIGASATATITSVGNSWYRCTMTFTHGSAAFIRLNIIDSATSAWRQSWTTAGTETILLWGAQIEQRSSATAYTPTTTTAITNYIPTLQTAAINAARLDYDPVTREPKGLLIEESRSNLFTYSDDLNNAAWTKLNATITSNTIIAPDGTLTGDTLTTSGAAVTQRVGQSPTATGSLSCSVYAKAGSAQFIQIYQNTDGNVFANFDLVNGVVGTKGSSATSTITAVGNGWYRCSISATLAASNLWNISIVPSASATYAQLFTATVATLYLWGAQLEAGAFPTSYIPTVASQVTRSADAASMTGTNFSSWFNRNQGTIFVNGTNNYLSIGSPRICGINAGGGTTTRFFDIYGAANQIVYYSSGDAAQRGFYVGTLTSYSLALNYNASTNLFIGTAQGSATTTNTTLGLANLNPTQFEIAGLNGTTYGAGWFKKIQYYPLALPNAELQEMTI